MVQTKWVGAVSLLATIWALAACSSARPGSNAFGGGTTGGSSSGGSSGVGGAGVGGTVDAASGGLVEIEDDGIHVDTSSGGMMEDPTKPIVRDGGTVILSQEQVDKIQKSECTGSSAVAKKVTTILQLVVDTSQSMEEAAPGDPNGGSKWDVTSAAILDAVDALPAEMAVGMQFFPTGASSTGGPGMPGMPEPEPAVACVDESGQTPIDFLGDMGSTQRTAIDQAIAGAQLVLGTPTHDGYNFALNESLLVTPIMGDKSMLLITDGEPANEVNCGPLLNNGAPTQPIIDAIAAAYATGIRTYVIGSPGSESSRSGQDMRGWLSAAAVAGGTAAEGCNVDGPNFCHFDMTQAPDFATALADGLAAIGRSVTDLCTFEMPAPPEGMTSTDPNLTSVIITWSDGTSELILRDEVGDCNEGWAVSAEGKIALCGATCERTKNDVEVKANVSLGCDPAEIIYH